MMQCEVNAKRVPFGAKANTDTHKLLITMDIVLICQDCQGCHDSGRSFQVSGQNIIFMASIFSNNTDK
jgi:hypothetical protein